MQIADIYMNLKSGILLINIRKLYGSAIINSIKRIKNNSNSTLNEEEIKAMFVDAYNKMIVSKDGILKNVELILNKIVSVESIEDKIKEVNKNIESVVNDVEILIHSSKEEDLIKQKRLESKYDDLIKELKELEHQKEEVNDKQNKINTFISNLKNKSDSIADFDEELFNVMVDKAIVNRDKSIEFIFNSGYKVKVEARK